MQRRASRQGYRDFGDRYAHPILFVAGLPKSGTTWLGDVLSQHPGVYIRKKEISFFIHHYHRGYRWYHEWFRDKGGKLAGEISVIPQAVLATDTRRVAVESVARGSAAAARAGLVSTGGDGAQSVAGGFQGVGLATRTLAAQRFSTAQPISAEARKKALDTVDRNLVAAGLIDKVGGSLNAKLAAELSFERRSCLPTPARQSSC